MELINQNRLRYFYEVYQRGSIIGTADALGIDASVITRQIKILEDELGMRLFERGKRGRGMTPTEAAELVLKYHLACRSIQDELEVGLQEMREMKRGKICISVLNSYIDSLTKEILKDFCNKYPDLNIFLEAEETAPRVIKKVLDDSAHIGITHGPINEPNINLYHSVPLPIYMLVNPSHPLAGSKKISLSEACHYPLALYPSQSNLGDLIQLAAHKEKIQLNSVLVSSSTSAKIQFVINTYLSGTFMSAFAAREEIKLGQLIPIEIDHPNFIVQVYLIVRRSRPLSPVISKLIRKIEEEFSLFLC
jgi:DNA-binding transcriptional LysR family regulator